jgi:hypothetical protein
MPAGVFRCSNAPYEWSTEFLEYLPSENGPFAATPGEANPSTCTQGTGYCFGDGSSAGCPCANESEPGSGEGCLHSGGTGGLLTASGSSSLSADTVVLHGDLMLNSSALYFQGTTQLGGGMGVHFGDGLRCVAGNVRRLRIVTNVNGTSQYPDVGDPSISVKGVILEPGVRRYQVWYRNAAPYCEPATFNLTNGLSIVWTP